MPLRPENTADYSYEKPESITSPGPSLPPAGGISATSTPRKEQREKPQGQQINKSAWINSFGSISLEICIRLVRKQCSLEGVPVQHCTCAEYKSK